MWDWLSETATPEDLESASPTTCDQPLLSAEPTVCAEPVEWAWLSVCAVPVLCAEPEDVLEPREADWANPPESRAGRLTPKDTPRTPFCQAAQVEVFSASPASMAVISPRLTGEVSTRKRNSSFSSLIPRKSSSFCWRVYCWPVGPASTSGLCSSPLPLPPRAFQGVARVGVADGQDHMLHVVEAEEDPFRQPGSEGRQAHLAVSAAHRPAQRHQAALRLGAGLLQGGGKGGDAVALHDPGRGSLVVKHARRQVQEADLRAVQPAQDGAHLLQQAGVGAHLERQEGELQQAHHPPAGILAPVFDLAQPVPQVIQFVLARHKAYPGLLDGQIGGDYWSRFRLCLQSAHPGGQNVVNFEDRYQKSHSFFTTEGPFFEKSGLSGAPMPRLKLFNPVPAWVG